MLHKLFSKKIDSITLGATLVAIFGLVSRLLGLVRDRILAGQFGAGSELDVYYAAFRIPDLIFNLLILGALSAGLVPVISRLIKHEKGDHKSYFHFSSNEKLWKMLANLLNILTVFLLGISVLGIIFAPQLMWLIAPGFTAEQKELTAALTRVMFLSPLLLGLSSVLSSTLQSFKRFFAYSVAPVFYNLGIIIGAVFFVPWLGIVGLAWGVVLGAFLHFASQALAVWQLGFRPRAVFDVRDKHLHEITVITMPRLMSVGISQVNLVVMTMIASTLPVGALAVYNLANNLQYFPIGIFAISYAIAAFPVFAEHAFNEKKLIEHFSSVFRRVMFFIIPSTVFLIALQTEVVRLAFGGGQFDSVAIDLTRNTLALFAVSLFAQSGITVIARVYYARHDSKRPFFISLFSEGLTIALALWLAPVYGVFALAFAFSCASVVNFLTLWMVLRNEIGALDEFTVFRSLSKFLLAAAAAGAVIIGVKYILEIFVQSDSFFAILLKGGLAALFGTLIYILVCAALRSEEYFSFWNAFSRRWLWKKAKITEIQ